MPPNKDSDYETRLMPNVIVLGKTGAGKSSVTNMLKDNCGSDSHAAIVSDRANSVTSRNALYVKAIRDMTFSLLDTVGYEDTTGITAILDGVSEELARRPKSLIVFVLPAHDIKSPSYTNDFKALRRRGNDVPVALLITYLEEDTGDWWKRNERVLRALRLFNHKHACITASKGKRRSGVYTYEEEYDESRKKVEDLIYSCLVNLRNPDIAPAAAPHQGATSSRQTPAPDTQAIPKRDPFWRGWFWGKP